MKYPWRAQTLLALLLVLLMLVACSGGNDDDTPTNRPPTVNLRLTPTSGQAPLEITATAAASDPDDDALSFSWQVDGQANSETGNELRFVLEQPGTYTVRITVSDSSAQASAEQTVTVTEVDNGNDTVVTGFVSEQSRNVVVILTSDDEDEQANTPAVNPAVNPDVNPNVKPDVNKINQAVSTMLAGKLGTQAETQPVVRGVNAFVMDAIFSQQEDANTLFNFAGKEVVATKASGEVVSRGEIGTDGSFNVPLTDAQQQEPLAFFVAEQNEDGSWRCVEQLEYGDGTTSEAALLNLQSNTAAQITLGSSFIPRSNSSDLVAGVATAPEALRVDPNSDAAQAFQDGAYRACGNENWRSVEVTANFSWVGEMFADSVDIDDDGVGDFAGFSESIIYDSSVGMGLFIPEAVAQMNVTTGLDNAIDFFDTIEIAEIRGIGPISATGEMIMEVVKEVDEDVDLSLTLIDIGLFDPDLSPQPYTPVFDLNDALRFVDPSVGNTTTVDDAGFAYGDLAGSMAYRAGFVGYIDETTGAVLPAENVFVIIVLQQADILAFNYALTNTAGFYQLMVPAVGVNSQGEVPSYFFGAFDFARNLGDFASTDPVDPSNPEYFVTVPDAQQQNFLLVLPLD